MSVDPRTSHKTSLLVLVFLALVVAMLVLNPAEAFAGEAKVDGSTLVYSASASEANNLEVYHQGSDYKIVEGNAALSVGSGCSISAAGTATCNGAGIMKILINVGPENDSVYIDEASVSVSAEINGGSENDIIYGGSGNEAIYGGSGNDELHGDNGDDFLNGGRGNHDDVLSFLPFHSCPTDDDILYGGTGSDTADYSDHGYTSASTQNPGGTFVPLAAGVSLDDSTNDGAIDGCYTPDGNPHFEHDNVRSDVEHLIGTKLNDTLIGDQTSADDIEGKDGNDTLDGRGGGDTLDGGNGDDTLKGKLVGCGGFICALRTPMTLDGGFGRDTADYSANTDPVDIDLPAGTATVGGYHDNLSGIENATGGSGDDTLTGDGYWNVLKGGGGKDMLNGDAGSDDLYGDDGDDAINSRDGVDEQVSCGAGTDSAADDNGDTLADCEVFIPKNVSPPEISGLAREGETLTVSDNGTWNGTPANYAYRWQRCGTGGVCTDIAGATEQSYALGTTDIGATVRVTVTASNVAGSSEPINSQMTPTIVSGDTTAPTVDSVTTPRKRNGNVTIRFSEPMDPSNLMREATNPVSQLSTSQTIVLLKGAATSTTRVSAKVRCIDSTCKTVILNPDNRLAKLEKYTVKVEGIVDVEAVGDNLAVEDVSNNKLAEDRVKSFKTGTR